MKLDILAVASHPDDVEMSCGGTVIKHTMQGDKVGLVDLTRGELGTRGSKEIRNQEAKDAAAILGIQVRENLDLGDGRFQNTTENQLKLIALIRKYQPDVLLGPAIFDRHPDHGKGANLVRDAWFYAGIKNMKTFDEQGNPQAAWRPRLLLHYIQDRWIKPDIVVDVSAVFDKKMDSVRAYKSQFHDPNSTDDETYLSSPAFMETLATRAREMGRPAGFQYAEGFTANNRFLGVENLLHVF